MNKVRSESYKNVDWLKKKIEVEKVPIRTIAMECGVTKETIKHWAKKLEIKRGTISQRWLDSLGFGITCPNCGERVPNGKYCSNCGKELKGGET